MNRWHAVKIASRLGFMGEVEKRVLEGLRLKGLGHKQIFSLRLALEEAVANAIKHGNHMDPTKHVTVRYLLDGPRVHLEVSDDGEGFDFNSIPDPTEPDRIELPHGRGIMLMRAYMDKVEYNEQGNTVKMTLRLRPETSDTSRARK